MLDPFLQMRSDRRELPKWDSLTLELAWVIDYNPYAESCTLSLGGRHGGSYLYDVPIAVDFGGAFETQDKLDNPADKADPEQWGEVERGPRWGVSYPVQVGDVCLVAWVGGNESTPHIIKFLRGWGDMGPAWVAKNLERRGDGFPEKDNDPANRFDICLPSGGWLRCLSDSSWMVATGPVNQPKAFISLHGNGDIDIHAEGEIRINGAKITGTASEGIKLVTPKDIDILAGTTPDLTDPDIIDPIPLLSSPESLAQSLLNVPDVEALATAIAGGDLAQISALLPHDFIQNAPIPIASSLLPSFDTESFFTAAFDLPFEDLNNYFSDFFGNFGGLAAAQGLLEMDVPGLISGLTSGNLTDVAGVISRAFGTGQVNIKAGNAIVQQSQRYFNQSVRIQEIMRDKLTQGLVIRNQATNLIDNNAPLTATEGLFTRGSCLGAMPTGRGRIICPGLDINPIIP